MKTKSQKTLINLYERALSNFPKSDREDSLLGDLRFYTNLYDDDAKLRHIINGVTTGKIENFEQFRDAVFLCKKCKSTAKKTRRASKKKPKQKVVQCQIDEFCSLNNIESFINFVIKNKKFCWDNIIKTFVRTSTEGRADIIRKILITKKFAPFVKQYKKYYIPALKLRLDFVDKYQFHIDKKYFDTLEYRIERAPYEIEKLNKKVDKMLIQLSVETGYNISTLRKKWYSYRKQAIDKYFNEQVILYNKTPREYSRDIKKFIERNKNLFD